MSKKVFDQIAEGLQEALAVARGEAEPYKLHDLMPVSPQPLG